MSDTIIIPVSELFDSPYYEDIKELFLRHRPMEYADNIMRTIDSEYYHNDPYIVGKIVGGKLVSMLRAIPHWATNPHHVMINAVHTLAEYRGQHHAKDVFARFIGELSPPTIVQLEVMMDNIPAISLYARLGFTITDTILEDDFGDYHVMEYTV